MRKILALCALVCIDNFANAMQSASNKFQSEVDINLLNQPFLTYTIDTTVNLTTETLERQNLKNTKVTIVDYGENFRDQAAISSPNITEIDRINFESARNRVLKEILPDCKIFSSHVIFDEDYPGVASPIHEVLNSAMFSYGNKPNFISIPLGMNNVHLSCPNGKARQWHNDFHKLSRVFLKAKENDIGIILSAGNDEIDVLTAYPGMANLLKDMDGYLFLVYGLQRGESGFKPAKFFVPKTTNFCAESKYIKNGICALIHDSSLESDYEYWGNHLSVAYVTAAAVSIKIKHPSLKANEIFSILSKSSSQENIKLAEHNPIYFNFYGTKAPKSHIPNLSCLPGMLNLGAALKMASVSDRMKAKL